jgi:nitroreductase
MDAPTSGQQHVPLADEATLRRAVASAVRAPSVYNSQPWRWRISATGGVDLYADPDRHLITTDSQGRDLLLSCGAALHHLTVALAGLGWATVTTPLPDPENLNHLARVQPHGPTPDPGAARLAPAIQRRHTDRRRFSPAPVATEVLDALIEQATAHGAELRAVTDAARGHLIEIITASATLQQQQLGYAAELAQWTSRYAHSGDGIQPGSVVGPGVDRPGDVPMRPTPHPELTQPPHSFQHLDASVLMVLSTDSDDRRAVLGAGEAMSAVLLTATNLGLATTPLSQPLEIDQTRTAISTHIVDPERFPQLVLRVGWPYPGAPELPLSPRRTLDFVLQSPGRSAVGQDPLSR